GLGLATGVAGGAAAGMEVSTAACGAGVAGGGAATTGSASLLGPREWGSRPVSAATPAAEKAVTEMAAAVSSGWRPGLLIDSIALFSCRMRSEGRTSELQSRV